MSERDPTEGDDEVRRDPVPTIVSSHEASPYPRWWEDPTSVRDLVDRFAERFDSYRNQFLLDCERGSFGDSNVLATRRMWGRFHPSMTPSMDMFDDLSQGEVWVLALMVQDAAHQTYTYGGKVPDSLTPADQMALRIALRDRSLYYSPEFLLHEGFGPDWEEHPALAGEVRAIWIESMQLAGPIETEINLRHRCAMMLAGDVSVDQIHLIAPGVMEYQVMMEALCQEFHDKVESVIRDYRE